MYSYFLNKLYYLYNILLTYYNINNTLIDFNISSNYIFNNNCSVCWNFNNENIKYINNNNFLLGINYNLKKDMIFKYNYYNKDKDKNINYTCLSYPIKNKQICNYVLNSSIYHLFNKKNNVINNNFTNYINCSICSNLNNIDKNDFNISSLDCINKYIHNDECFFNTQFIRNFVSQLFFDF